MPNHALALPASSRAAHSAADIAVARVWDTARVALKAREVAAVVVMSGASDEQVNTAVDAMADALNGLCEAVRSLDAISPNRSAVAVTPLANRSPRGMPE